MRVLASLSRHGGDVARMLSSVSPNGSTMPIMPNNLFPASGILPNDPPGEGLGEKQPSQQGNRVNALPVSDKMPPVDQLAEQSLSKAMAQVSKKLGLFERVRHVCQSESIPIPGVVVVGEQSAGKSSLLENISGIQFPRAQNTCTRMPCVLTLLTDPAVEESYAMVSMDPNFENVKRCSIPEVEEQIKALTEKHATGDQFISSQAMYISVVRREGPQLSLIDLPGITHNSSKMTKIHEVTVKLVENYIKPEEMVILCVIPASNDFGNAEVVELAKKYDPDGERTLGVVTKCDDVAKTESSDIVEKVLMERTDDVRLELGFHCVVNRSQKDIDEGMSREDLLEKGRKVFSESDRMKRLPKENWGTLALTEKIAKLQEHRVDAHLPKINEAVRKTTTELQRRLCELPPPPADEKSQFREFQRIVSRIRKDLEEGIKGENFVRNYTITRVVDSKIKKFKKELQSRNPKWLEEAMIGEVSHMQENKKGYTVDNMTGPHSHIFINLIKKAFIEEELLKDSVHMVVRDVGEHLRHVVFHVIQKHASMNGILPQRLDATAQDCIDQVTAEAQSTCDRLAEAQEVTSTENEEFMARMTKFQNSLKSLSQGSTEDGYKNLATALLGAKGHELPEKFHTLVKESMDEKQKDAVVQICASLYVYTEFMIECFVETSAKLIKSNMVHKLADKLEGDWMDKLSGSTLHELFAEDEAVAKKRKYLAEKINALSDFKAELRSLQPAGPPVQKLSERRMQSEKRQTTADAKTDEVTAGKTQPSQTSSSPAQGTHEKSVPFVWNFLDSMKGLTLKKGQGVKSKKFTLSGVPLQLTLYPEGTQDAKEGYMSLFISAPERWQFKYKATYGDVEEVITHMKLKSGWTDFARRDEKTTVITLQVIEAIPPKSKA